MNLMIYIFWVLCNYRCDGTLDGVGESELFVCKRYGGTRHIVLVESNAVFSCVVCCSWSLGKLESEV